MGMYISGGGRRGALEVSAEGGGRVGTGAEGSRCKDPDDTLVGAQVAMDSVFSGWLSVSTAVPSVPTVAGIEGSFRC